MKIEYLSQKLSYTDISLLFSGVKTKPRDNVEEKIYVLEHQNVYSAGRSVINSTDVVKRKIHGVPVVYSDRGGLWTWHGPGQVVVYFVYDLRRHDQTIHDFLSILEQVVLEVLEREIRSFAGYDIEGASKFFTRQDKRGFWHKNLSNGEIAKVGFIGLRVVNGFVIHGISVNYNNDLSYFDFINPCGLGDVKIASVESILKVVEKKEKLRLSPSCLEGFKKKLGNAIFDVLSKYC